MIHRIGPSVSETAEFVKAEAHDDFEFDLDANFDEELFYVDDDVDVDGGDAVYDDEHDDEDDGAAWKGNSWNTEIQSLNRDLVRRIADVIVPGHGRPFKAGRK